MLKVTKIVTYVKQTQDAYLGYVLFKFVFLKWTNWRKPIYYASTV